MLLGQGKPVFDAACQCPVPVANVPDSLDRNLAGGSQAGCRHAVLMIARVFGLWWVNACRIVYHLDGHHASRRCGFAYGTLPGHIEQGEERFMVEWDHEDNVWYDLRAFSRPRYWLVRLGYPIARRLQRRFVRQSQAAMRRIVAAAEAQGEPA